MRRKGLQRDFRAKPKLLHDVVAPGFAPAVPFTSKDRQTYQRLIQREYVAVNCLVNRKLNVSVVCSSGLSEAGHPEICIRGFPLDSLEMCRHALITFGRRYKKDNEVCKKDECVVTSPGLLWAASGIVSYKEARAIAEMADGYYGVPVLVLEMALIGLWSPANELRLKFQFAVRKYEDGNESRAPTLWSHVACRLDPISALVVHMVGGQVVTQHGVLYDAVTSMEQFRACIVCFDRDSVAICSGCYCVAYCGTAHQDADWERHKGDCEFYRKNFDFASYLQTCCKDTTCTH